MSGLRQALAAVDDARTALADLEPDPPRGSALHEARQYLNWAITAIQRAETQ